MFGNARARASATLASLVVAAGLSGLLAAPHPAVASSRTARARFLMGTRLSIETDDPAPEDALDEAFGEVSRLETILSNWRATSEISRLNREAARGPVACSPDLFDAIAAALRWAEATGGTFDPTVEPLVVALGLRGTVPGPTQTWLMVDADSLFSTLPGSINDYPDAGDNHGADGHNALFADGHSEWVAVKGNRYLLLRELSQDDGKSTP